MDEATAMEHLSYGKGELQTADASNEDNLKMMSDATAAAIDPFNQHDYSVDQQIKSMRDVDYPMKPERRTSPDGYNKNIAEVLAEAEDITSELENWQQNRYDQNNFSGQESFQKTLSPVKELLLSDHQANEMHDMQEELQDDIASEIHESLIHSGSKMLNDAQYNSLAKHGDGELINQNNNALTAETNNSQDDNDTNLKNISSKERTSSDDVRKISDKLEAFNKNNEMSNIPTKTSRPKIEDTEMPTKGVVSNLKSLFESNAVHNNNDTCKSASYKLEYGVGRSSGTLNKGVFH
ncbi:Ribosome maturation protein SBDS [Dirofilaria immitis]